MIRVTCQCGSRGQVPDTHAGKQIKCRKCGSMIAVPRQLSQDDTEPKPAAPRNEADPLDFYGDTPDTSEPIHPLSGLIWAGVGVLLFWIAIYVAREAVHRYAEVVAAVAFFTAILGPAVLYLVYDRRKYNRSKKYGHFGYDSWRAMRRARLLAFVLTFVAVGSLISGVLSRAKGKTGTPEATPKLNPVGTPNEIPREKDAPAPPASRPKE
jgi:hypothetical protein